MISKGPFQLGFSMSLPWHRVPQEGKLSLEPVSEGEGHRKDEADS